MAVVNELGKNLDDLHNLSVLQHVTDSFYYESREAVAIFKLRTKSDIVEDKQTCHSVTSCRSLKVGRDKG